MPMNDGWLIEMFDQDKPWLERQPEMTPWERGCRNLVGFLDRWYSLYFEQVCRRAVEREERDGRSPYLSRLWQCVGYHWQDANRAAEEGAAAEGAVEGGPVAMETVVEKIESGQGFRRGGRLGGNPLRDVVLAVAMADKDDAATRTFEDDYFSFSRGIAGKYHPPLAKDTDEWWYDLLDHLAGYTNPPGKLDRFYGRCALQNWLGTVVWNFLRRRKSRNEVTTDDFDALLTPSAPGDYLVELQESLHCFMSLVREALQTLSDDQRLLLTLIYVDGLRQNQVAGILGVHPGRVTRRRQAALARFRAKLEELGKARLQDAGFESVLDELETDPQSFAAALLDALEGVGRNAEEDTEADAEEDVSEDAPEDAEEEKE